MKARFLLNGLGGVIAWGLMGITPAFGAGQTSDHYAVAADVFASGVSPLVAGSAHFQISISVDQSSAPGWGSSSTYGVPVGYQATVEGFDSDYDGIADNDDPDSDGDGIPDDVDARPYDTDQDGLNNVIEDDDDDADGLQDTYEQWRGTSLVKTDTDGDDLTDFEEDLITLDDPLDPQDVFKMARVRRVGTNDVITWHGNVGVTNYYVMRNNQVTNTAVGWSEVAGPIAGTGDLMEVSIPTTSTTFKIYTVTIPY